MQTNKNSPPNANKSPKSFECFIQNEPPDPLRVQTRCFNDSLWDLGDPMGSNADYISQLQMRMDGLYRKNLGNICLAF